MDGLPSHLQYVLGHLRASHSNHLRAKQSQLNWMFLFWPFAQLESAESFCGQSASGKEEKRLMIQKQLAAASW